MRSEEVQVGKRVRVKENHHMVELRTSEGTVIKRWGDPSYAALDVLLDDGNTGLFWYHELEDADVERSCRCR